MFRCALLTLCFLLGTPIYSYASEPFGSGSEKLSNIRDLLSESLCADAERTNNKITRDTYVRTIIDIMKITKFDYRQSKNLTDTIIRDAYKKCPEDFSL